VFELVDGFNTELVRVVVVVAVSVVVTVVAVVVEVVSVMTVVVVGVDVMPVVTMVVVVMRMRGISIEGLGGDLSDGNMGLSRVVVVVHMTRDVVIPLRNRVITVRINLGLSGDGLGQGGGETEEGNGDDGGLHYGCSKGF
jgi:hypothetical protein